MGGMEGGLLAKLERMRKEEVTRVFLGTWRCHGVIRAGFPGLRNLEGELFSGPSSGKAL